jgi:hypothetical protein
MFSVKQSDPLMMEKKNRLQHELLIQYRLSKRKALGPSGDCFPTMHACMHLFQVNEDYSHAKRVSTNPNEVASFLFYCVSITTLKRLQLSVGRERCDLLIITTLLEIWQRKKTSSKLLNILLRAVHIHPDGELKGNSLSWQKACQLLVLGFWLGVTTVNTFDLHKVFEMKNRNFLYRTQERW